jgi:hypothetical protein
MTTSLLSNMAAQPRAKLSPSYPCRKCPSARIVARARLLTRLRAELPRVLRTVGWAGRYRLSLSRHFCDHPRWHRLSLRPRTATAPIRHAIRSTMRLARNMSGPTWRFRCRRRRLARTFQSAIASAGHGEACAARATPRSPQFGPYPGAPLWVRSEQPERRMLPWGRPGRAGRHRRPELANPRPYPAHRRTG